MTGATSPTGSRGRGRPRTGVREAVLAAATALLAEAGAAGFTTKAVAARAGVSEASIFYHFDDRLGLLEAVIFAQVGGYQELINELTGDRRPATLEAGLRTMLDFLEAYFVRLLPGMTAMQADPQTLADFRERSKELDLGPHRAVVPVQQYLRWEQAAGRVSADADLPVVATFLVGSALQRAQLQRFGGRPRSLPSNRQLGKQLLRLLAVEGVDEG
ncbi:MAG TPA: TetR/AcrR family transcriptional regulator [Microlunatus sp.]